MANYTINSDTQIQIQQPLPGTTPTQILAVGPNGVIDLTNSTAPTLTTQAAPALVLGTTDPSVSGALYIIGNSQVGISGIGQTGKSGVVTINNTNTQTLTFVCGLLVSNT